MPIKHPRVQHFNEILKKKMLWNFVIRLVIEAYLELAFSVYFNLKYTSCDFNYFGSWNNYFFALMLGFLLVASPFFILGFYHWNFTRFSDEDFQERYGSVYEGLKKDHRSVIFYMAYFVIRRASFALSSVLLYEYVVLQIEISMLITLIAASYIIMYHPYEEPLLNRLEVMTECFTLLLLGVIFAFTDMFLDTGFQYSIGFLFVIVMCLCIGCHLYFLARGLILDLIKYVKTKIYRRKIKLARSPTTKRLGTFGPSYKGCAAMIKQICWLSRESEQVEHEENKQESAIKSKVGHMMSEIKEELSEEEKV